MNVFYLFMLILGTLLISIALQQQLRWNQRRKIIDPADGVELNMQSVLDYQTIFIENSRWLRFLSNLNENLSMKLRIFAGIAVLLFFCKMTRFFPWDMNTLAVCLTLTMVIVIILPGILIKSAINSRIKLMLEALPYFVDLIAVCVQAGMTVESAVKFIAERSDELDSNLACLMRHLVKRAEVSGLEDALHEFYRSMEMAEMRMFCSTLQQSVHYGTSLYENLTELSQDIRALQLLESEQKIGKLSAKMSVPLILFIMFPITVLVAAPGILRIMKNGLF